MVATIPIRTNDLTNHLKDTSRRYGGDFVLLWHNSHFITAHDAILFEALLKDE